MKRAADDIAELARQLEAPRIILGGHDWGGVVVFRVVLWHPELVSHLFSVCTPYNGPSKQNFPLEAVVARVPNFKYQIQLGGPDVEQKIKSKAEIKQFLNAVYGGKTDAGEIGFTVTEGVVFEKLPLLKQTKLISEEVRPQLRTLKAFKEI